MQTNEILNDINECTSRGACSVSPAISALEELAVIFLQHNACYILKLERLGAKNDNIKYQIINTLASLVSVNEFNDKQLYEIVRNEYFLLEDTKKNYRQLCKKENLIPKEIKSVSGFNSKTAAAGAISIGEKYLRRKYKKFTPAQKNFTEILLIIIKSVSLNLTKLSGFAEFDDEIYHEILKTLNMYNREKISLSEIKSCVNTLADLDNKLQLKISSLLLKTFGGITKVMVSHSTRRGKAVLVSGSNFFDLLSVLEETKDKDIDIYTHSNLLIVHALERFKRYEHLKGHYGDQTENCILDFATFPGSILLTKNSGNSHEYFYRGRLFSNDYIVPNGVIKIENNDYTNLIETALNAKGFSKGRIKEDTPLGFDETDISQKFENLITKLKEGEISRLYIIGINAHLEAQKIYFNEFFKNLLDDEFVISFSYESKKDNVLTINTGNYIPLVSRILNSFFEKFSHSCGNIVFFFTTCDVMTISSIVLLKNIGAKHLYMAQCPPTIINPAVFETFKNEYNIENTTTAKNDLSNIRKNKSSL